MAIEDLGALIGGLATAAAAGGGLLLTARQIQLTREGEEKSSRWRRVEFIRSIVDQLNSDDEVQFCLRALDWGVGPLLIPSKHKVLFPEKTEVMNHDVSKMERALQVHLPNDWNDPCILIYRYSFDHFFSLIENIRVYGVRLGDEFANDVGLSYYEELIRLPPYLTTAGGKSPLYDFVKHFYRDIHARIWSSCG